MENKQRYAFFDFDGTLTDTDTFLLFGRFVLGDSKFFAAIVKSMPWIIGWKLGLLSNSEAKQHLFTKLFKGFPYDGFSKAGVRFVPVLDKHIKQETMRRLDEHLKNNDMVAIVSASMAEWIKPWAKVHGVSMVLGTIPETDSDGKLTGRFKSPNCHGQEKVNRIRQHFGDLHGGGIYVYGDSNGDKYMWEMAHHPFKVVKNRIVNIKKK